MDWKSVEGGNGHTCALKTGGSIWCWGLNANGQLGIGGTAPASAPTQVGTGFGSLAVDFTHTCGVKTNGEIWCWGLDALGQLGDGVASHPSPVPVRQ
jgi:alpha-tubulin suppressor-like RCC1 family protein